MSSSPAIAITALTKSFRRREVLRGVDLTVPTGTVVGYLGPNGAGKTTTLRILVGLLRPTTGSVRIFDLDAVADRDAVQAKVGYLQGDFVAYPHLTGQEYLDYLAALRGGDHLAVDDGYVATLAKRFEVELDRRIGTLSHGNRQKIGIIQAFMHQPDLLILDEPTSGLDPLMQREFLTLVREQRDAGRTVLLSSHILSEVDQVADQVAIIRAGQVVEVGAVDQLRSQARRRIDLTFAKPPPVSLIADAAGVREVREADRVLHVEVEGSTADLITRAAPYGVVQIATHEADLEEIFLRYYGQGS